MSIEYALDPASGIVHTRLLGTITAEAFRLHAERMDADPAVHGAIGEFVDLSEAELTSMRGDAVRDLASLLDDTPVSKRVAVWAPGDLDFGMARMYGASADCVGAEVLVFRQRDAALAWLRDPGEIAEVGASGSSRS